MNSIDLILDKITNNILSNKDLFLKHFNSLDYRDKNYDSLLHLIIKGNGSYAQKKSAILTLLKNDINPMIKDKLGNTFIHLAIQISEDMDFIIDILLLAIQHGYNVNILNSEDHTILHEAIFYTTNAKKYNDLIKLINWLRKRNFNFDIKNKYGENLIEYINNSKNLSGKQKIQLKEIINNELGKFKANNDNIPNQKQTSNNKNILISNNQVFNVSKYGNILTDKLFLEPPVVGRDEEIYNVIISLAQDKKLPLLVGPSGVGKTSIVDQIAYMIKNKKVPKFLIDKKIYEVTPFSIVAGTSFRGDLEKNMKEILDYCLENDVILFIDEFHMIYGSGSTRDNETDIAAILKNYIDRHKLSVIGATTDIEYEKYMANDPLKRRFEIIKVTEPKNEILLNIIMNTFDVLASNKGIGISKDFINHIDDIVNILIELTQDKNRVYNDKVSNPDLVIGIIDKTFAYALVDNSDELKLEYLISSITSCERIYQYSKESAVKKLNLLFDSNNKKRVKDKIINFNEYKKNN